MYECMMCGAKSHVLFVVAILSTHFLWVTRKIFLCTLTLWISLGFSFLGLGSYQVFVLCILLFHV